MQKVKFVLEIIKIPYVCHILKIAFNTYLHHQTIQNCFPHHSCCHYLHDGAYSHWNTTVYKTHVLIHLQGFDNNLLGQTSSLSYRTLLWIGHSIWCVDSCRKDMVCKLWDGLRQESIPCTLEQTCIEKRLSVSCDA